MTSKDYYSILGITKDTQIDEIKKAYRKLAMQYHPDRNKGDKGAETKFKEINEAYGVLSNPTKKQQYDTFGSVGGDSGFGGFSGSGGFNDDVDLGDIFSSFFGGDFSGSSKRKSRAYKGEDLEYILNIDLKTSIYGGKETLRFTKSESCKTCNGEGGSSKKTCSKCNGRGQVTITQNSIFGVIQQNKTCDNCMGSGEEFGKICNDCDGNKRVKIKKEIEIDIPAGIDNSMIIKMTGEGNDGVGTSVSGDLYVKFSVDLNEKGLKRKGVNLYYDIEISVIEAILGTKKEIILPIIGKKVIEIKPGTQFGNIIKIQGNGVKHIDRDSKGDLFINLDIKIPKKLSKIERDLYENIAKEKKINVNNKKGVFENFFG